MPHRTESVIKTLRLTYGLVPAVAGADKFFNLLTDWKKYLSPRAAEMSPVRPETLMKLVGLVEIGAGAFVLRKRSRASAYLVSGWLLAIAANLINQGDYDIAVRDIVMAIGAASLGTLIQESQEHASLGLERQAGLRAA